MFKEGAYRMKRYFNLLKKVFRPRSPHPNADYIRHIAAVYHFSKNTHPCTNILIDSLRFSYFFHAFFQAQIVSSSKNYTPAHSISSFLNIIRLEQQRKTPSFTSTRTMVKEKNISLKSFYMLI